MTGAKRKFTDEVVEFISENRHLTRGETALLVNERFDLNINKEAIQNARHRYGIRSGLKKGIFQKGHVPANKGKKGKTIGRMAETQFKKGQPIWNHRPIGSEQVRADGYIWVKIAEPNKWKEKHRILWESVNGSIPKGNKIVFIDQDRKNVAIENLMLVTDGTVAVINKHRLLKGDKDLNKSVLLMTEVVVKSGRLRKRKNNGTTSNDDRSI
ncbi:MAG: HNH endonuclease signature motif containing protein [Candidatus Dehalobacter alkaniphilus]